MIGGRVVSNIEPPSGEPKVDRDIDLIECTDTSNIQKCNVAERAVLVRKAKVELLGRVSLGRWKPFDQVQCMPLKLDAKSQASHSALFMLG